MSAMLVVDVAMIVMRGIAVFRHTLTNDSCVRGGVAVMMMPVIVRVMSMNMMKRCRVRQCRRKLRPGSAVR